MYIGNPIPLEEKSRTYYFPGGDKVVLNNVVELIVRESGTHRVKTKDPEGNVRLHIIPPKWIHIEIDDEYWTV
jgi:hypothetical protein